MRTLLLLLLSFSAFAQTDFFEKYYPLIDQAEEAFINEEYNSAILFYESAFKEVEKPLARDIYNAIVCYYMAGNIDSAKPLLLQLASKGIDPQIIESQSVFDVSTIREAWQGFKPIYLQVYQMFTPDKDVLTDGLISKIQEEMDKVRDLHQKLPDVYFEEEGKPTLEEVKKIKEIEAQMDELYLEISVASADYILVNGFPKEFQYGIVSEDLGMDALRNFLSNIGFYNQLQKAASMDKFSAEKLKTLKEKLIEEVGKGSIHRDYVWDLLSGDAKLEFVRVVLPETEECESTYVKPRNGEDLFSFENEELLIAKAHYYLFKNLYFLMSDLATSEDIELASCKDISPDWIPVNRPVE
ncbi:hypothetical protein Lbys_3237 [Leadbetterella byssophila DSM 17132]|uniref:TPR repeat-containing protein n=1 Tax=Leadbetterella byssophila (strain DSM 17132 / JCM 16389 / KACC 11308 / NBRC 106382 / 4M15) TaxID=649349 RepID=E4RVY8_LEAB4|nr:hypothetical protein [Leadbetterella byssophila]ADQ18898.1 hypothetical protein Lbys_3237 [Leadbetterella byssophila DSM 17132]